MEDKSGAVEIDKLAFEGPKNPYKGYTVKAFYLKSPKADALVEIFKDNEKVRSFLWPGYKIWNIAAHFEDIVDGEIEKNKEGYAIAGSDGLGGGCMPRPIV